VILASGFTRSRRSGQAREIYAAGGDALRVGVFVDSAPDRVVRWARRLRLDVLQLHGEEAVEDVRALRREGDWSIWKSVRLRLADDLARASGRYSEWVDGLLVEGWTPVAGGGTGARFPWASAASARLELPGHVRFIAAGGLRPDNVGELIDLLAPDVVDVSSGVEASLGVKSREAMRAFVRAARGAAESRTR
jgi:phosphoribosylanthranilate isomerase